MGIPIRDGRSEVWTGTVIVEGISVEVDLTVDVVALILELGERAARNSGCRSQSHGGAVVVRANKPQNRLVRAIIAERRAAERARTEARSKAWKDSQIDEVKF